MSKPNSGLFTKTKGSKKNKIILKVPIPSENKLSNDIIVWSKNKETELLNISKRKRERFNTATVVYDIKTKKEYFGRNQGIDLENTPKNSTLFGNDQIEGILPKISINKYKIGNCAEVDAVNKALNDGAKLKNLILKTIHTTTSNFGENKEGCENCKATFDGRIKLNYSGWRK